MRNSLRSFHVALMALAAFTCGDAAHAQLPTRVCANENSSQQLSTCLRVSTVNTTVGSNVTISAWFERYTQQSGWFQDTGTVNVRDGNQLLFVAQSTRTGATPTQTFQMLAAGEHVMTATSPDGFGGTSTISVQVGKFTPQFSGTSVSAPFARAGDTVQFVTDLVTWRPNGPLIFRVTPPGGFPTEYARTTLNNQNNLVSVRATGYFNFAPPYTTPGTYKLSAQYGPDANNLDGYSIDVLVKLGPFPTTTSLTQSSTTSLTARPVTLTAAVTAAAGAYASPTGTVEFYEGTTLIGSAPLNAGSATLTTTQLRRTGSLSLTARYAGDSWNQPSTSAIVVHELKFDPAILVPILELLQ
ncbi:MAG TPA: Ig-like domain-containing protein [Steroidobacteraceae bacterium]|nr:Ig-like domain-containing protein [Steroidobacteraceae bacterium]